MRVQAFGVQGFGDLRVQAVQAFGVPGVWGFRVCGFGVLGLTRYCALHFLSEFVHHDHIHEHRGNAEFLLIRQPIRICWWPVFCERYAARMHKTSPYEPPVTCD